ncbi:non-ribosomal peptide synthetase [Nisaea nitritireducens]|uniref:non-ribosomal peptide synthetase n=1 Tax=Nisaea nitritireducens TaxID=568392 RepID=UPI001868D4A2|nr:non-ribosomal peptide synthetase [Nisaea nitritireducens]
MSKLIPHRVFEYVAAANGSRTAIEEPGRTITYAALNEAANRAAHGLTEKHALGRGDVVALSMPVGVDYVIALLAVAKAGGVFLPLDPAAPPRRQAQILSIADPVLAISDRPMELAPGLAVCTLAELSVDRPENPELTVEGDDASYIVFTSGSTGMPKAILGSQKGLSHFLHWEISEFGLGAESRVSQLAPATFDVSLRDILAPLLAGGTLCIPPDEVRTDSRRLLSWLETAKVSLVHCVPSLFRQLMAELGAGASPDARLPDLQHVLLAGEPLYGADIQRWHALMGQRIQLTNLYGPSETTLAKAFHRITETPDEPGRMVPVGTPLPNSALLVIKEGELCDPGEIGEVFIKTPFMSKGYLGAPDLMAESFVQNPLTPDTPDIIYRSGDIGRYLENHTVELLGRKDQQVKINGIRIELAEVEASILQHPGIETAVVVAHRSTAGALGLTAYFMAAPALTGADIRHHLADWLPPAMQPAHYVQMEQFPLNLHGKIDRRALPLPADLLYQDAPCIAPANDTETSLAALWGEVLELQKVSVTHSFVDLGGDSLKAIRVLSRVYQDFGVEARLQELFPDGTVRGLARVLTARGARREHASAQLDEAGGLS